MILFNLQVEATDADVDRPNNIQYALSGSYSDRFQIDPNTGKSFMYLVSMFEKLCNFTNLNFYWMYNYWCCSC